MHGNRMERLLKRSATGTRKQKWGESRVDREETDMEHRGIERYRICHVVGLRLFELAGRLPMQKA